MEELGKALRGHRNRLGLYQFQLGQRLGVGERTVQRAERGQVTRPYLKRWLRVFEPSEPELAAQVRRTLDALDHVEPLVELNWCPPEWARLDDIGGNEDPMERRAFLGTGAALAAGALLDGSPAVKVYEQDVKNLMAAYSWTPAQLLWPQVQTKLVALEAHMSSARGEALQRLLIAHAELHLLAGYIARWDLVEHRAAAEHRRTAAKSAREAGDADLLALVLAQHGLVIRVDGNATAAVKATEEACRLVPNSRPASASYVQVVASELLAKVGKVTEAHHRLDKARTAIARVGPGSLWRGPGSWGPRRMRVYESYTLRSLERHGDAYELLWTAPDWTRDQPKHATAERRELAQVLYEMGEIEAAAEEAAVTYRQAQHIQFGNVQDEIRGFCAKLAPHGHLPAVRELGELVQA